MRRIVVAVLAISVVLVTGCATTPPTAVSSANLEGDKLIYFEQSDRIPKEVLLAPYGDVEPVLGTMMSIDPAVIAQVFEKIIDIVPEITKGYNNERMHNALLGRRILIKGYATAEELQHVESIVEKMSKAIENITPEEEDAPVAPTVKAPVVPSAP